MAFITEQPGRTIKWDGSGDLPTDGITVDTKAVNTATGDKYEYRGSTAEWVNTAVGGGSVVEQRKGAQEQGIGTSAENGVFIPKWNISVLTANTDVSLGSPAIVGRVVVTASTATADIQIRDAASAGTGTIIDTIPAASVKNYTLEFDGAKFNIGLYVDFNGASGTVRANWWPQA